MRVVLLLVLLTVSECDSRSVVGLTGQSITLPCKYDRKTYGALGVCWGRGEIPLRGCNDQLITTPLLHGYKVARGTRKPSRYQLLGRLEEGDVSLTILNLTEEDAGRYGCRVQIHGLLNDDKHHFDLTVTGEETRATSPVSPSPKHENTSKGGVTEKIGSDVTEYVSTEPTVTLAQRVNTLQMFVGNTLRLSFLVFIPALLLTAAYRIWRFGQRSDTHSGPDQSEEQEVENSF
ncbi:hepatitis A virus cellular receptor 1 homolog [Cololabis saira]|uniref:hepatitis A virus cellular receptor 1 homolog n=1 Tax=Cololabis saira TaxID=129043 RepID=UPI002AD39D9D|nr:hepatitis A virus cellular receptor 1 homolog [Cololabis saira]